MIFSASYDDTIRAWRFDEALDDWVCAYTIEGHSSTVWSIDFDATEQYLCSVGEDKDLIIWQISDREYKSCGRIETAHTRTIFSVSWCKSENYIATAGGDNKVLVYEVNPDSLLDTGGDCEYSLLAETSKEDGHTMDVNGVCFHPSSSVLCSVSDD